jgi:hypothetical protein
MGTQTRSGLYHDRVGAANLWNRPTRFELLYEGLLHGM